MVVVVGGLVDAFGVLDVAVVVGTSVVVTLNVVVVVVIVSSELSDVLHTTPTASVALQSCS